jgi:hypothetical protein
LILIISGSLSSEWRVIVSTSLKFFLTLRLKSFSLWTELLRILAVNFPIKDPFVGTENANLPLPRVVRLIYYGESKRFLFNDYQDRFQNHFLIVSLIFILNFLPWSLLYQVVICSTVLKITDFSYHSWLKFFCSFYLTIY